MKTTRLQQIEKKLFYCVYNWGFFHIAEVQPDFKLYESPAFKEHLKAYRDEVIRLEKQEELEKYFRGEADIRIKECHDNSCGYEGCPAK